MQQPEIQKIERKLDPNGGDADQILPWELIAGAGIGSTFSMMLILAAVCTYRRRQIDSSAGLLAQEESQDATAGGFKELSLDTTGGGRSKHKSGLTKDESSPDLIPRGEPCGAG